MSRDPVNEGTWVYIEELASGARSSQVDAVLDIGRENDKLSDGSYNDAAWQMYEEQARKSGGK